MLASDFFQTGAEYQNPANPWDVNVDGLVQPLDTMLVANRLLAHGGTAFSASTLAGMTPLEFLDVNGDDWVSTADFDAVAGQLNQGGAAAAECTEPAPAINSITVTDANNDGHFDEGETIFVEVETNEAAYVVGVTWGDGSWTDWDYYSNAGDTTFNFSHVFVDDDSSGPAGGSFTLTITALNFCGDDHTQTHAVTIENVAPGATLIAPDVVNEGAEFTLTLDSSDVGIHDTLQNLSVDWGDGTTTSLTSGNGTPIPWGWLMFSHTYADDNPTASPADLYTITVSLTDDDGGTGTATQNILVENVRPTLAGMPSGGIVYNGNGLVTGVILQADFIDPGLPDTHRVNIAQRSTPATNSTVNLGAGTSTFTTTLDFDPAEALADVLPIRVNIEDDDSSNSHLIVTPAEFSVNYGETLTGDLSSSVTDPGGGTLQFQALGSPAEGTFNLNSDGTFSFTPNADFFGGTTVMLPTLVTSPNGSARFAIIAPGVLVNAPEVGHEMAWASFWVSSTGMEDPADTDAVRVPLAGPVPFSPITPSNPNDTNAVQVTWIAPPMPISTHTDAVLAFGSAGSPVGGAIGSSDSFVDFGTYVAAPEATSPFNTSNFAGVPTGFTYSASRYTIDIGGPAGAGVLVPINLLLHVNTGATNASPVNRIANQPHWVYAEILPAGAGGAPPVGAGTYIVGRFDGNNWIWAQQVDAPDGVDVFFTGQGPPISGGFDLNLTVATSAAVMTGSDVVIYTAVGWDSAMPGALNGLLAPAGMGDFPAIP